jgi:hypothetical protein
MGGSSKATSSAPREPAKLAGPAERAAHTPGANLGNLQNFLRERVDDLTKALEAKASADFHDWLVCNPPRTLCGVRLLQEDMTLCRFSVRCGFGALAPTCRSHCERTCSKCPQHLRR